MKQWKMSVWTVAMAISVLWTGYSWGPLHAQGRQPGKRVEAGGAEPMSQCEERFAEMDADNDGYVVRKEFLAVPHGREDPEVIFRTRDANNDGFLAKGEFCGKTGTGMGPPPEAGRRK